VSLLIGSIITGGVAGYFFYRGEQSASVIDSVPSRFITRKEMVTLAGILGVGSLALLGLAYGADQLGPSLALASVFSGMSLTLFGGGYVIIPIMQQAVVSDLGWVTLQEFNAAIGISQVTPGPILSSVTFIGYKMAGISGAVIATIAIFLPSAMLMLLLTHVHEKIKHLKAIGAIMMGIRAVVIGLIFSGAYTIGIKTFGVNWLPWTIFVSALAASLFTRIHPALLIGITFAISLL
jgi:chromate transporter